MIRFKFTDVQDVFYFTSSLKTMTNIWMGDVTYRTAKAAGDLTVVGSVGLTRNITEWMKPAVFADLPPANEI